MPHVADLIPEYEEVCRRVTGKTLTEWEQGWDEERRRALMLTTIRRGQLFTGVEMFGLFRDGKQLRQGWKSILGLDMDDIKTVQIDAQPEDLTDHERYLQAKARTDPKTKFTQPTIRRVSRFQIEDHVFENGDV